MKKLIKKLLFSFLIFNFLFSIGERVNDEKKYSIKKVSTFNEIIGWTNVNGVWKSSENKIPEWDVVNDIEKRSTLCKPSTVV